MENSSECKAIEANSSGAGRTAVTVREQRKIPMRGTRAALTVRLNKALAIVEAGNTSEGKI